MKKIHVAIGVVLDTHQNILIAERPIDKHLSGLWEFPGGKVEPGETAPQALARELEEEVGITPLDFQLLIQLEHDYSKSKVDGKTVLLDVYLIHTHSGTAHGREQQAIKWVPLEQLSEYQFPEANEKIIGALEAFLN